MKQVTTHGEQVVFLKRIEGQIRGIQKMIDQKRYCIDILTQLHSVVGAILRVEDKILKKHLDSCVAQALKGRSAFEKQRKIDEIVSLIDKFRKT
jgi:DNA-binding FrmR family transcriptional regulator